MELFDITEVEEIKPIRNESKEIIVSIWCITYNHGAYIRDTLEGFVSQKIVYNYEIVIFDDASTDDTTDIIREYIQKYPNLFHVFFAKRNIYKHPMRKQVLNELKRRFLLGKYIAGCEGDDYWTNVNKLQMQVDYMERNPDCALTIHDAVRIHCIKKIEDRMIGITEDYDITAEELLLQKRGAFPTASMVVRKEYSIAEGFFLECGVGDWSLQLYVFLKGRMHYFGKCMSVYRYMHTGSWSARIEDSSELIIHCAKMVVFLEKYDTYTNYKYHGLVITKQQQFIEIILSRYSEKEVLINVCEKCNKETDYIYADFIKRILMANNEKEYEISVYEKVSKFVKKYKYIFIMGTGKNADKITKLFIDNNIYFKGYVVSNNQIKVNEKNGKAVLFLSEIPYKKMDIGIVVAIRSQIIYEPLQALEEAHLENFICPLLV